MTLRHLQIFKAVCGQMSITKAAERLNMTQPAVSIAIKEAEVFYNAKLFERIGRKIYLTEAGIRLKSYADAIIESYESSIEDIREMGNNYLCKIGANATIAEIYLPGIVKAIKKSIPEINLQITIENNSSIEQKLKNNMLDIALIDAPSALPQLSVTKIHTDKMVAISHKSFTKGDSMTLKELCGYPLILREKGSGWRSCIDSHLNRHGLTANISVSGISNNALISLCQSSMGITFIPLDMIEKHLAGNDLKVINITDSVFTRDYYLSYLSDKTRSDIVNECIDVIKRYF